MTGAIGLRRTWAAVAVFLVALAVVALPVAAVGSGGRGTLGLLVGPALLGCTVAAGSAARVAVPLAVSGAVWMLVGAAAGVLDPIGPALERLSLVPAALVAVALAVVRPPSRVLLLSIIGVVTIAALLAGSGMLRPALIVIAMAPLLAVTRRSGRDLTAAITAWAAVLTIVDLIRWMAPASTPVAAAVVDVVMIAAGVACVALSDVRMRVRAATRGSRSTDLGARLGAALGVGPLQLAFPDGARWVDDRGAVVDRPPGAVVVRDAAHELVAVVSAPPGRRAETAASLLAPVLRHAGRVGRARAGLQDAQTRIEESRQRLLRIADEEREALQRHVSETVASRMDAVAAALERSPGRELLARRAREAAGAVRRATGATTDSGDLRELLMGFASPSVDVRIDGETALNIEVARTVRFVVAESLANAMKHAQATTVTVTATATPRELRVEVVDDGVGGADAAGAGLLGLRDRVDAAGASLSVVSPRGGGTTVTLVAPRSGALRMSAPESEDPADTPLVPAF